VRLERNKSDVTAETLPTAEEWNRLWELDFEIVPLCYCFATNARDVAVSMEQLLEDRQRIKELVDEELPLACRLGPLIKPIAPSAMFGAHGACTMHGAVWGFARYIVGFARPQDMRGNVGACTLPDQNASSHLWNELENAKEKCLASMPSTACNDSAIGQAGKKVVRPKRSTEKCETQTKTKIVSFLVTHHQYYNGSCGNFVPVGVRELERKAVVSRGSVSKFFKAQFGSHKKYKLACCDRGKLGHSLRILNGDLTPSILFNRLDDQHAGSEAVDSEMAE
jgi:hypothetical protein